MPDVRSRIDTVPGCAVRLRQQVLHVERLGGHLHLIARPGPLIARAIHVEFQPIIVGIGQVQRLTHGMIGGSLQRPAVFEQAPQNARQPSPVRQTDGDVIQAGGAARLGPRAGISRQDNRRSAVGREIDRRILPGALAEAEQIAVERQRAVAVRHAQVSVANVRGVR
jgi:hypothetical protein